MAQDETAQPKANSTNWLWLSSLGVLGLFALSTGRTFLGAGFLLLGVFLFFNNPMKIDESIPSQPGKLLVFSWACGLAGAVGVLFAALTSMM